MNREGPAQLTSIVPYLRRNIMNIDKVSKIRRRILSISVLFSVTIFLVFFAPIILPLGVLLSALTKYSSLINAILFLYGYLYFEVLGVIRLGFNWLFDRNDANFLGNTRNIQTWWSSGLLRLGKNLYRLNFQVTGIDQIKGPSAIILPRHTSLGDTVLPIVFFAHKRSEGLRYVLKRELLIIPCLDIAGNRLPNLFVDRSGLDTAKELKLIKDLVRETPGSESILLYPEGTRSSPAKRQSLAKKNPNMVGLLERWPDLLPPRKGGPLTILEANIGKDVVFLAHTGFEGSASILDLIDGSWLNQKIHLHFWRIKFSEIPKDKQKFLFEQWDFMQHHVSQIQNDQLTSSQ